MCSPSFQALKDFQHGKEPELRPLCGSSRVELFPLYQAVASRGGRAMVPSVEEWAAIAKKVVRHTTSKPLPQRFDARERTSRSHRRW